MIFRHAYKNGVWVDLEQPTEEDVREIAREFSINEQIEKELLSPTLVPLTVDDGNVALLVLHFPTQAQGSEDGATENQEVDIVVGNRFIITVRYEVIAPLYHLKKLFEMKDLVSGNESITTDILLEILFVHLYASVRDHTSSLTNSLESIECNMFDGHERTTVRAISGINRAFLHLEASLANHEEPLQYFLKAHTIQNFFDNSFSDRAGHILAERTQIMRLVKTHRAVATEMRETNLALLEARQNEIMKTLTIITVIVLPLELIAFVFGMNLPGTPFESNPNAFQIVMAFMLGAVVIMTLFFAKKRWIF